MYRCHFGNTATGNFVRSAVRREIGDRGCSDFTLVIVPLEKRARCVQRCTAFICGEVHRVKVWSVVRAVMGLAWLLPRRFTLP